MNAAEDLVCGSFHQHRDYLRPTTSHSDTSTYNMKLTNEHQSDRPPETLHDAMISGGKHHHDQSGSKDEDSTKEYCSNNNNCCDVKCKEQVVSFGERGLRKHVNRAKQTVPRFNKKMSCRHHAPRKNPQQKNVPCSTHRTPFLHSNSYTRRRRKKQDHSQCRCWHFLESSHRVQRSGQTKCLLNTNCDFLPKSRFQSLHPFYYGGMRCHSVTAAHSLYNNTPRQHLVYGTHAYNYRPTCSCVLHKTGFQPRKPNDQHNVVMNLAAEQNEVVTNLAADQNEIVTNLAADQNEIVTNLAADQNEIVAKVTHVEKITHNEPTTLTFKHSTSSEWTKKERDIINGSQNTIVPPVLNDPTDLRKIESAILETNEKEETIKIVEKSTTSFHQDDSATQVNNCDSQHDSKGYSLSLKSDEDDDSTKIVQHEHLVSAKVEEIAEVGNEPIKSKIVLGGGISDDQTLYETNVYEINGVVLVRCETDVDMPNSPVTDARCPEYHRLYGTNVDLTTKPEIIEIVPDIIEAPDEPEFNKARKRRASRYYKSMAKTDSKTKPNSHSDIHQDKPANKRFPKQRSSGEKTARKSSVKSDTSGQERKDSCNEADMRERRYSRRRSSGMQSYESKFTGSIDIWRLRWRRSTFSNIVTETVNILSRSDSKPSQSELDDVVDDKHISQESQNVSRKKNVGSKKSRTVGKPTFNNRSSSRNTFQVPTSILKRTERFAKSLTKSSSSSTVQTEGKTALSNTFPDLSSLEVKSKLNKSKDSKHGISDSTQYKATSNQRFSDQQVQRSTITSIASSADGQMKPVVRDYNSLQQAKGRGHTVIYTCPMGLRIDPRHMCVRIRSRFDLDPDTVEAKKSNVFTTRYSHRVTFGDLHSAVKPFLKSNHVKRLLDTL